MTGSCCIGFHISAAQNERQCRKGISGSTLGKLEPAGWDGDWAQTLVLGDRVKTRWMRLLSREVRVDTSERMDLREAHWITGHGNNPPSSCAEPECEASRKHCPHSCLPSLTSLCQAMQRPEFDNIQQESSLQRPERREPRPVLAAAQRRTRGSGQPGPTPHACGVHGKRAVVTTPAWPNCAAAWRTQCCCADKNRGLYILPFDRGRHPGHTTRASL
jgi:hypothetical protein